MCVFLSFFSFFLSFLLFVLSLLFVDGGSRVKMFVASELEVTTLPWSILHGLTTRSV